MLNTVLYVVYLGILSLLPAHIAARSFRFAFFPAMQISLGNQKASQWIESVDGFRLLRRGIADDCHICLGEIAMIRTCYAPKRHSV